MALDTLLENEANAEIEQIRAQATTTAEEIIAKATEKAEDLITSRKRLLEAQSQAEQVRARSAASLELNAARLNAGEEGLQKSYDMAHAYITAVVTTPEYKDILGRLIAQAKETLPNAEAIEVHSDEVAHAQAFADGITVRANDDIRGGVRLVAKGGKSGVTNTLLGRLERVKAELAPEVSRILAAQ